MSMQFRFAKADEYPAISEFLDTHWAKGHVYTRDEELFRWTFLRANHWDDDGYSFALAEDNGELVGILGGIPFVMNAFGQKAKAVWIVNYVIRPDHRKGTGALQLLSMFRKAPFEATVAAGITKESTVIYRVLRGQVLDPIPRHFMVLPNGGERFARLLSIAHPDWPVERAEALRSALERKTIPTTTVESYAGLPQDWDQKHWPAFAEKTVGAERDSDYLCWRYQRHPRFEYRFISVADGLRSGLAVWRLETIRQRTDNGLEDVDRIGRLVEFLPASEQNARDLLTAFSQELSAAGAFGADYYGFHGPSRAWLAESGFTAVSGLADAAGIPTRFQPLDGKTGDILSAMFVPPTLPPCSAAADCAWYWTKSDSDQDRPN
jgi:hypothetical protein